MARGARPILYGPRAGLPLGTFPGQPGNLVGFAAAPGFTGLTNWPGGGFTSNTTYRFFNFNLGVGQICITSDGTSGGAAVTNVTLVGCLFQGNNSINAQVDPKVSTNITFSYCSFVPPTSLASVPPGGGQWPSNGVGTGITVASGTYSNYVLPYQSGWFATSDGFGPNTWDHCDFWGFGQASINFNNASTGLMIIRDCWIHDARNNTPLFWNSGISYNLNDLVQAADAAVYISIQSPNINHNPTGSGSPTFWTQISTTIDHTDGIGYVAGSAAPSNIVIQHCTIAMIGNVDNIAMQTTSTQYTNWTMINNYISGNNTCFEAGHSVATNANIIFTDNIFATDIAFNGQLINFTTQADWRINGNTWKRNTLRVYPGDTWSGYSSGQSGQFVWPDNTINSTDFV